MVKFYPAYLEVFNENGSQFEMIVILLVGEHTALPENCVAVSKQRQNRHLHCGAVSKQRQNRQVHCGAVSKQRQNRQLHCGAVSKQRQNR